MNQFRLHTLLELARGVLQLGRLVWPAVSISAIALMPFSCAKLSEKVSGRGGIAGAIAGRAGGGETNDGGKGADATNDNSVDGAVRRALTLKAKYDADLPQAEPEEKEFRVEVFRKIDAIIAGLKRLNDPEAPDRLGSLANLLVALGELTEAVTAKMIVFDKASKVRDEALRLLIGDIKNAIALMTENQKGLANLIDQVKVSVATGHDELEARLIQLSNQYAATQATLANLAAQSLTMQRSIDALNVTVPGLKADLLELKTQFDAHKQAYGTFVNSVTADLGSLRTDLTNLKVNDLAAISARVAAQEGLMVRVSGSLATLTSVVATIQTALNSLDGRVATLETNLTALQQRVDGIDSRVTAAQAAIQAINSRLNEVALQLENHDRRLLILEFSKSRGETIAALKSRLDVALAWTITRTASINSAFCQDWVNAALSKNDYKTAKQADLYCREKLAIIQAAAAHLATVNGFLQTIASSNVDVPCSQTITVPGQQSPVPAENLTNPQLAMEGVLTQLLSKCSVGQARVMALFLDVVRSLSVVPEYRPLEVLQTLPVMAQTILATGGSSNFDLFDDATKNSAYGQIERLFKGQHYILAKYGAPFPQRLSDIRANPPSVPFTWAEVNGNNALRALELEQTGFRAFRVAGQATFDRGGKDRYSYPSDPKIECPIDDDFVVGEAPNEFVYHISYPFRFDEKIAPVLMSGAHIKIFSKGQNLAIGRNIGTASIPRTGAIRVTAPWGYLGSAYAQCLRFTHSFLVKDKEWIHPEASTGGGKSGISSYLNGFEVSVAARPTAEDSSKFFNNYLIGAAMPPSFQFLGNKWPETTIASVFSEPVENDQNSPSWVQIAKIAPATTQLNNYWISGALRFFDTDFSVGPEKPLYAASVDPTKSYSSPYIREGVALAGIKVFDGQPCNSMRDPATGNPIFVGFPVIVLKFSMGGPGPGMNEPKEYLRYPKAIYQYFADDNGIAGGRCAIDTVACKAWFGRLVFGQQEDWYNNYQTDKCLDVPVVF